MYAELKIARKSFVNLCEREHAMKVINFKKKKNKVINKRAAGII